MYEKPDQHDPLPYLLFKIGFWLLVVAFAFKLGVLKFTPWWKKKELCGSIANSSGVVDTPTRPRLTFQEACP